MDALYEIVDAAGGVEYAKEARNRAVEAAQQEFDSLNKPSHEAGAGLGLSVEWYRDVLRAKLVTIKMPKRLLTEYRDRVLEEIRKLEITNPQSQPKHYHG